jgi:transcriptional regulator with XRE-family HTH domain
MTPPPIEPAVREPFRANLRRLRILSRLSQEQLAARTSLHRTAIGLMENGERLPRIDTLIRLAGALEVTPNDLLQGIEWAPPREQAGGRLHASRHLTHRVRKGADG